MELPSVGEKTAMVLREAGYVSPRKIASASADDIAALPGIGQKTAEKIVEGAAERMTMLEEEEEEEEREELLDE
jgi:ERCC4-type nuclease